MLKDARGQTVATTQAAALEEYERALRAFQTFRGDPLAHLERALEHDAGFAGAYVARALMLATFFERRFMREAQDALARGREALAHAGARERALADAAQVIAAGDWEGGARALDRVLVDWPREVLALQVAHALDFYRGDALNLRNRVTRVLPAWSASVPGYAYVLGMRAFGLEECNQHDEAERAGRQAVALSGDDCWGVHAVAHVLEMQGRVAEGLAWYGETRAAWAGADNGFAYHNHWHVALFHLDGGDLGKVLEIYDARFGAGAETALMRVDATALLWRLKLEGASVAARFAPVADAWEAALAGEAGFYAFNDFHAALALAAAGRRDALRQLRENLAQASGERGGNAEMTRAVGSGACEAAIAYCEGRHADAVHHLLEVRDRAQRFGGSHAQRDLLSLTLIDAAWRAGEARLAQHVLAERLAQKPGGRWGARLQARIAGGALPRAA